MNPFRTILWLAGAGLPAVALALWFSSAVTASDTGAGSGAPMVLAQASQPNMESGNPSGNGGRQFDRLGTRQQTGGGIAQRRALMDVLGWQAMGLPRRQGWDQMLEAREQEEWSRMLDFLQTNSPNLYHLLQNRPPVAGTPERTALMRNWLNLQQLERNQSALYDLRVQEIQQRDAVLGLLAQLIHAEHHDPGQAEMIKQQIQSQEAKVVDLDLRERELRIKNLQETLDQQRSLLNKDMANKDQIAAKRAQAFISRAERFQSPTTRPSAAPPVDVFNP
jgi:hypothetical protein